MDEAEIEEIGRIVKEVGLKYDGKGLTMKAGEVFPTDNASVVGLENGKPSVLLMKWGFPKHDGKGIVINARSESASHKRMFQESFANQRCVIPSTGFFEWTKGRGADKQKFLFNMADDPMLYMAGLYADYLQQNDSEQALSRFVILTKKANNCMSDIHNRMPVILYKSEIRRWLTDVSFAKAIMSRDSVRLIRTAVEAA